MSPAMRQQYTPLTPLQAIEDPTSPVDGAQRMAGEPGSQDAELSARRSASLGRMRDVAAGTDVDCGSVVEGTRFQSFVGLVIIANTLVLGLETDIPWSGWDTMEEAFLIVFVVELALRLIHRGFSFFIYEETCGRRSGAGARRDGDWFEVALGGLRGLQRVFCGASPHGGAQVVVGPPLFRNSTGGGFGRVLVSVPVVVSGEEVRSCMTRHVVRLLGTAWACSLQGVCKDLGAALLRHCVPRLFQQRTERVAS